MRLRASGPPDLALRAGDRFTYVYDFGDDWEHEVLVEKVIPMPPPNGPEHPEHEEYRGWLGPIAVAFIVHAAMGAPARRL